MNELMNENNVVNNALNKATILMTPLQTNLPIDEELFYLLTDSTDREKLLNQEIDRIVTEYIPPQITFKVDKPDGGSSIYEISVTQFGFTLSEILNFEKDTIACNFFNKDLANDFEYIDIEFLRGLIALLLLDLQKQIDIKIEAFDMLYSPSITEYLTYCIGYITARRKIKTK